jgi:hypothetical protein
VVELRSYLPLKGGGRIAQRSGWGSWFPTIDASHYHPHPALARRASPLQGEATAARCAAYNPNTYSTVAFDWFCSSGFRLTPLSELLICPEGRTQHTPDAIAMYCRPFTA